MARITRVKSAQQRYETVILRDEDGNPIKTPVMQNGVQKTTKKGRPVFMTKTVADKTRPKPNLRCDFPGCDIDGGEIKPGTAYMHISPKSGPYGGRQLSRHQQHRAWFVWEYSSSMSARLAQISHDFWTSLDGVDSPDDVQSALDDAATAVRELAEEKRESASNIEKGFGHETEKSQELNDVADQLDSWADEIEQADIPDLPDIEARYFVTNGDGQVSDLFETDGYETEADAEHALAMHRDDENNEDDGFEIEEIEPDEPTEEQMSEWRDSLQDSLTIVDESPV